MKKGIIIILLIIAILAIAIVTWSNTKKSESTNETSSTKSEEAFYFSDNGKELKIGENFLEAGMPEANNVYEAESCAFDGIEKTYTYSNYEITTCPKDGKEEILTIYLLTSEVETKEGVKIGDSVEKMKEKYGENYKDTGLSYIYEKEGTQITFIAENDQITSIEYRAISD